MIIHVIQGKRGRWRWQLKDGERHICMSGIRGFDHRHQAERAAMDAFGGEVYIETTDGEQFAGERDFATQ